MGTWSQALLVVRCYNNITASGISGTYTLLLVECFGWWIILYPLICLSQMRFIVNSVESDSSWFLVWGFHKLDSPVACVYFSVTMGGQSPLFFHDHVLGCMWRTMRHFKISNFKNEQWIGPGVLTNLDSDLIICRSW